MLSQHLAGAFGPSDSAKFLKRKNICSKQKLQPRNHEHIQQSIFFHLNHKQLSSNFHWSKSFDWKLIINKSLFIVLAKVRVAWTTQAASIGDKHNTNTNRNRSNRYEMNEWMFLSYTKQLKGCYVHKIWNNLLEIF